MSRRPLLGKTTPRLWTPPKRKLTPQTSRGYAAAKFAESLGIQLYPWQKWLLVHALETNPDGSYRFRVVIVLVARQNGKTTVLQVLTLWRMLEDGARTVVGTSTSLEYAREAWAATVELAEHRDLQLARERALAQVGDDELPDDDRDLLEYLPRAERWVWDVKRNAVNTSLLLRVPGGDRRGHRYRTAAASRTGGRSLSVDLGIADELREHREAGALTGWEAWDALDGATTARANAQMWGLSNAGDHGSIVLNHWREAGIGFIETGEGDDTLGMFEWSAPDGADLFWRPGWAQANPSLGYGPITEQILLSKAKSLPATSFRTENLCQGVPTLKAAIDSAAWKASVDQHGSLDGLRSRVAVTLEVSEDLEHVTLIAAALLDDGRCRAEVVAAWASPHEARTSMPGRPSYADLIKRIKPRLVGWLPGGPGAVFDVELSAAYPLDKGRIQGRRLVGTAVTGACQGLAEQVKARRVLHGDDPLLNAHVTGASKLQMGDGWRFVRRDAGHVDAAYALAGAVHLARQIKRLRTPTALASA